jgi:hypothetical protein
VKGNEINMKILQRRKNEPKTRIYQQATNVDIKVSKYFFMGASFAKNAI